MIQLRDYQAGLLDRVRDKLRAGQRRVLLQLSTGGGKTVIAATMLGGAASRSLNAWFVVHRKELLAQTSDTFNAVGIRHGFIASGMPIDGSAPVQLCGIQTLVNRLEQHWVRAPDLIVWDEAHHAVASSWARVMNVYPSARHIGLTATPERMDGRGLKDHFDELITGPSTAQLIKQGWLSPYRYYAPGTPDLAGMRTTAGDFNRGDLGSLMDDGKLIGDIVDHYQRLAAGLQGIVFAVNREHSRHIADAFKQAGIRAAHVDGAMPDRERDEIVRRFRAGSIEIMSNCDLFGEGFDVPAVSYVGLARPTQSLALHLQQVGRALRVLPGKEAAIICDHAGNAFKHGMPDDARQWTLDGRKKGTRARANDDALPIHQCPDCYQVTHSSVAICPCGYEFPSKAQTVEFQDGELFELDRVAAKNAETEKRKAEEKACQTLSDFIRLGMARGYKNPSGWAKHRMELKTKWRKARYPRTTTVNARGQWAS